jgi:epoxyqueuosine reductase
MTPAELAQEIKKLASQLGYVACGITSAEPFTLFRHALDVQVERFPKTRELYRKLYRLADPCEDAPWAKSIVACVRWYGKYKLPSQPIGFIGRNYLGDRRYPGCPDHTMPRKMKQGLIDLGMQVKTGGVPDRWAAVRAGVARFGKNCFVFADGYGSWINVEAWRVDAEMPFDEPTPEPVCPEGCTACIGACPTGALCEPFVISGDKCISHLTYGAGEPIEPALWKKMGRWIYGCDICQDVCPINRGKWVDKQAAPWMESVAEYLSPEALVGMSQKTYDNIIHPRFWYIPKTNLARWHRNAKRSVKFGYQKKPTAAHSPSTPSYTSPAPSASSTSGRTQGHLESGV